MAEEFALEHLTRDRTASVPSFCSSTRTCHGAPGRPHGAAGRGRCRLDRQPATAARPTVHRKRGEDARALSQNTMQMNTTRRLWTAWPSARQAHSKRGRRRTRLKAAA